MFTSTFPPYRGGMGNVAFNEAKALGNLGHHVTVLTPEYDNLNLGGWSDSSLPFGIRRLKPLIQVGNGAFCSDLFSNIEDSDILYLHYPFFGVAEVLLLDSLFREALPRRKQKFIIRYDMDVVGTRRKRLLFLLHTKLVMPAILKSADKVIFSSNDYASTSNAAWLLRDLPHKCTEIPYGVDPAIFFPEQDAVKHNRRVLFVGGLDNAHYFKGLDNLMQAIAPLILADRNTTLHIVGNGNLVPHYERLCRQLKIEENVRFVLLCDDNQLRKEYSAAIVTVLPSTDQSESFGLVLLESMACGTAIIASDLPGVRTLVQHGKNGYLVERHSGSPGVSCRKNIESLRSCVSMILSNPSNAISMGKYAREFVTTKYNWNVVAGQLEQCF